MFARSTLGLMIVGILAVGCNSRETPPTPVPVPPKVGAVAAPSPSGPPLFEDVTANSGIQFQYRNGEDAPHLSILESLGGGLGVIDFDGDGKLDLFLVGGGHFGGADQKQILGHPCKLFRNLGNWKFEDVTNAVGLDKLAGGSPWFYSHGVTIADYDRDGWSDILVSGWGRVALLHNEPNGPGGRKFTDVTLAAGLDGTTWTTSCAWADFDGDGLPDLFLGQYVDWSFANHPACNYDGKTPDVCPPKKFQGLRSKVYRNLGAGKFADVSETVGLKPGGPDASKSLGVVVVDINQDGKPDVYVANDTVANFLYVNKSTVGQIRFEELGLLAGVAMDGGGKPNGSMGVDAGDPECTGKPCIWVTNYENEFHAYYRNLSTPQRTTFVFATESSGVGAIGQKFVGWGTGFVDLDHDGWEDLVIVNGHAIRFPTGTTRRQRPVLFQNRKGRFVEMTKIGGPYFQEQHLSRGAVLADMDNDGRVDLLVANMNEPTSILRNVCASGNHWLGFKLVGAENADIVGARVQVTVGEQTQTRFAKGGGSYASHPDRRMVFGLGSQTQAATVTVFWPNGTKQTWNAVAGDKYYTIRQGVDKLNE